MTGIVVTVIRTAGSAPREAGAQMLVRADGIEGTIGGGRLEWEAMRIAREMLTDGRAAAERSFALGPALGQCCGGSVTLGFRRAAGRTGDEADPATGGLAQAARTPLWIWGAGHVGRALVATLAPLPHWRIAWIDIDAARFPEGGTGAERIVAAAPPALVRHAPVGAHHLIVTHSHEIDLALCHALLGRGFGSAGLIGSATKWARFRTRLAALGHSDAQISRIACPIGDPSLGKHPQAIAVGVAAALLKSPDRAKENRAG